MTRWHFRSRILASASLVAVLAALMIGDAALASSSTEENVLTGTSRRLNNDGSPLISIDCSRTQTAFLYWLDACVTATSFIVEQGRCTDSGQQETINNNVFECDPGHGTIASSGRRYCHDMCITSSNDNLQQQRACSAYEDTQSACAAINAPTCTNASIPWRNTQGACASNSEEFQFTTTVCANAELDHGSPVGDLCSLYAQLPGGPYPYCKVCRNVRLCVQAANATCDDLGFGEDASSPTAAPTTATATTTSATSGGACFGSRTVLELVGVLLFALFWGAWAVTLV